MTDSAIVTLLFTDLVGSTALKQRVGDDEAERIRRVHFGLLRDALASGSGHEVKNLGDGLMVVFGSALDACSCAVAMQQSVERHNRRHPERLDVRIGLHVGEPVRDEDDYFGSDVDLAKRICDAARGGQVLVSDLVRALVGNRGGHSFARIGELELKGIPEPVATSELAWTPAANVPLLTRTPFVGRGGELGRIGEHVARAATGTGGLLMVVGEPGIGKTRIVEEAAERARSSGAAVFWGRCFEGDWTPPYGPFAEAVGAHAANADPQQLRTDLGLGAAPVAQLVPALRDILPDIPQPARLQPDEERFRLLDAVSQFFIAVSARSPVVVVCDDLHWADRGSIAMLRHVARFAPRNRILVLGMYRDVELDRAHPLAEALGAMRRETEYERIHLDGLRVEDVGKLIETIGEHDVPLPFVEAIARETDGNPFFIREVLLHLVEEGKIYRDSDGRWTSHLTLRDMAIPEGVREVIGRRLSRLPEDANRLLSSACAFDGPFRLDVVAAVAGLEELAALDAIDAALAAQIVEPTGDADTYGFTHALIRHTLESELSPSRQVRLHRRVAEALEEAYGERPTPEQSAELAYQYHQSAAVAGAERGVVHALRAADNAEGAAAHDETVAFLRMALELISDDDLRRPRVLARLGLALVWALQFEESQQVALDAAKRIADTESRHAAAEYLGTGMQALVARAGGAVGWPLATAGLAYLDDDAPRDATWARLIRAEQRRLDTDDPHYPGLPTETADTKEAARILVDADVAAPGLVVELCSTRAELVARARDDWFVLMFWTGDYARAIGKLEERVARAEREADVVFASFAAVVAGRCHIALGDLDVGRRWVARSEELAERIPGRGTVGIQIDAAWDELRHATDEDWEAMLAILKPLVDIREPSLLWALAPINANGARLMARTGDAAAAMTLLEKTLPALERAPASSPNFVRVACDAAETLWLLDRQDHIDLVERALLEKVVGPDFRYPMQDGRLSLARLAVLRERYDEAARWFADARRVLDEQGALPLRAIVDFDEALAYLKRDDAASARPLLEAARRQFAEIGMSGWLERADELLSSS